MSKDLFDETTMSFGDHLEELRACLWKALIGLVVGVIGGLFVAPALVRTIQDPIEAELKAYYEPEKTGENGVKTDGVGWSNWVKDFWINRETTGESGVKTDGVPAANPGNPEKKGDGQSTNPGSSEDPTTPELKDSEITLTAESLRALWRQLRARGVELGELPQGDFDLKLPVKLSVAEREDAGEDRRNDFGTQTFGSGPAEAFLMYLKVSLIAGIVFSSPWVFYQIWTFVAAGLYQHEKKYVHIFLPVSLGLFLGGVFFCFFLVIPLILNYLFKFNAWLSITPFIRVSEWVSFAVMLPIMFGVGFQLPLVMLFLERIGIFTVADFRSKRRIAILVIAIASMMLTPPDPTSMISLMVPMVLLYEVGIWMVVFMRRRSPFEEEVAIP